LNRHAASIIDDAPARPTDYPTLQESFNCSLPAVVLSSEGPVSDVG